jgi:hypothetical protein
MNVKITDRVAVDVDTIRVEAPVYWADEDLPLNYPGRINDKYGLHDTLELFIDIQTGQIKNWPEVYMGVARCRLKVDDRAEYSLYRGDEEMAHRSGTYVPKWLPNLNEDYLDFKVSAKGLIRNWQKRDADDWAAQMVEFFF